MISSVRMIQTLRRTFRGLIGASGIGLSSAVLLVAVSGCASTGSASARSEPYEIAVTRDYTGQKFDIVLTNLTADPLCFMSVHWPGKQSHELIEHELSYVQVGRKKYREPNLPNTNCWGCALRLAPGAKASTSLKFPQIEGVEWGVTDSNAQFVFDIRQIPCFEDPQEVFDRDLNLTYLFNRFY